MKIFKHRKLLIKEIIKYRDLCFVPTMGGLHKGHEYLIKKAKQKKGKTIVSIFVNEKQFDSRKDYRCYPRDLKLDFKILKKLKVDYLYLPKSNDIYNFKTKNKIYEDKFIKELCGKFRKSHFKGVLDVVNRLLEIIKPTYIYLGKKDYQQMYLINKHIVKSNIKTKVVKCKTIREKNGVACSSRNKNLSSSDIKIASNIYDYLTKYKKIIIKTKNDQKKSNKLKNKLLDIGATKIDYIKSLNINNPKNSLKQYARKNLFIAYYLKNVRLIDNF